MAVMALEQPRSSAEGHIGPFVHTIAGSVALDHTATPGRPCYLDTVYMTLGAGVAAENMTISIYTAAAVLVTTLTVQAMAALTYWTYQPARTMPMLSGWYVRFQQANANAVATVLKVAFKEPS